MSKIPNPHAVVAARRRANQRRASAGLPPGYIRVGMEIVDGDMARVTGRLLERLVATGRMSEEEAAEQRARWCAGKEASA